MVSFWSWVLGLVLEVGGCDKAIKLHYYPGDRERSIPIRRTSHLAPHYRNDCRMGIWHLAAMIEQCRVRSKAKSIQAVWRTSVKD